MAINIIYHFYRNLRRRVAVVKAYIYDRRLGIDTKPISGKQYPAFYGRLEKMVKYLQLDSNDVFIDLGSGQGRVVFFVAIQRLRKVIGVELDSDLIEIAKDNLRRLKIKNTPIEFFNMDAINYDVREGTVFFMYCPFDQKTLEKVLDNIKLSLSVNNRKIRIIYYGGTDYGVFRKNDWLVFDGKIENNACLVWRNKFF